MDSKLALLHDLRSRVVQEFERKGERWAIRVQQNQDSVTLDLCSRMIDEIYGNKWINIDYDPETNIDFDKFMKTVPVNGQDLQLLTIIIGRQFTDYDRLWQEYIGWLGKS